MTWIKSSIHWLLTSKQGFFSFQHELYTSGCWSPYIQWIIFFYFIFHAANIKSVIDCRFPEDGQDLLYSYGVLGMTLISFQHRDDLVNYGCKEIKQLTTPENIITYYNALCLSPQIVHKHCLQFLLGVKMALREKKNWKTETVHNAYAKFWGDKKEHYGIFWSGQLRQFCRHPKSHSWNDRT